MVSLVDIYNIKESVFDEIKSKRDPARGNKSKNREKDYYFIDEPADPETGAIKSKVVRKISIANMFADLEAEVQDFEELGYIVNGGLGIQSNKIAKKDIK